MVTKEPNAATLVAIKALLCSPKDKERILKEIAQARGNGWLSAYHRIVPDYLFGDREMPKLFSTEIVQVIQWDYVVQYIATTHSSTT